MFDVIRSTVSAFTQMRLAPWQALGDTLLVGEGNLSFAKALLRLPATAITHMTATTYEKGRDVSDETSFNAYELKRLGALVLHDVDATKLNKSLRPHEYDTVIFQFPNVGSRDAKYGRNPNHVLIRNFLRSAKEYLAPSGKVIISAVDNPHSDGAFNFEDAAVFANYKVSATYPFDPSMFPGYSHINTNDDESALDGHSRFITWVFETKQ